MVPLIGKGQDGVFGLHDPIGPQQAQFGFGGADALTKVFGLTFDTDGTLNAVSPWSIQRFDGPGYAFSAWAGTKAGPAYQAAQAALNVQSTLVNQLEWD